VRLSPREIIFSHILKAKVKKIMKNPATTMVIFNCQLRRPGRLALVKGEGTVSDNLRRVQGHEPLTSILSPSKRGEAAVYQVDDDWSPRAQI